MATLKMIDVEQPITLMANSRGRITDQEMVDLAAKMAMPHLLNVSQGTEGAESLEIADAPGFIAWIQANRWAARLEQDLQCISQDSEGRPILTTWVSTSEFEQMAHDAQGSPFGDLLQRALDMWRQLGPDEIVFDGYKAVAADRRQCSGGDGDRQRSSHRGRCLARSKVLGNLDINRHAA